jgi:prophage antirepressor-like protein
MDPLKLFVFDGNKHEVRTVVDGDRILFRASDIGKVLGLTNVRASIIDFHERERCDVNTIDTIGRDQITIFLTERGVYKLVLRSRKPVAIPFQEWVYDVIDSVRRTGNYDVEKAVAQAKEEAAVEREDTTEVLVQKYKSIAERKHHDTLMDAYNKKAVVYFAKVVDMDGGKTVYKIGSSNNIRVRTTDFKGKFGPSNFVVVQCFQTPRAFDFERFLQKHRDISPLRFRDEIVPGERSTEAFLMTPEELEHAVRVAKANHHRFVESADEKTARELREMKEEIKGLKSAVQQSIKRSGGDSELEPPSKYLREDDGLSPPLLDDEVDTGSDEEVIESRRGFSTQRGRKVQSYSPDGKSLIKTYARIGEALRDLGDGNSAFGLRDAISKKTVYKERRWWFVDKSIDENEVQNIGGTVEKKKYEFNAVLRLSEDGSTVDAAYASRTELATVLGFTNGASVVRSMQNGTPIRGRKYVTADECPQDMIDKFLSEGGIIPKNTSNKRRTNFVASDPISGNEVERFDSLKDVCAKMRVTKKPLMDAINGNLVLRKFKWKIVE